MKKLKAGDTVIVITGNDKGKTGTISKMFPGNKKCLVTGIRLVKKHVKPNPEQGVKGGVIPMEAPINCSNLMIYNPAAKKADKVQIKTLEDDKKVRCYKSTGEIIKLEGK